MWSRNLRFKSLTSTVRKYQTIAECYKGKSVFMTGGTGFLGKVLLEKLLYSCPGIDKIYLLVREKPGATAQQRVQTILEMPLFSRLKAENQQALQKIIPVAGDITEPRLGIKASDKELLADKVSLVFHVAANINLDDPLEDAMNVNVEGTGRTLDLSKDFKNLKAFIHVSTAYSNANNTAIEERIYPPPASIEHVRKLLSHGINEKQLKEILGKKPNTYIFTKALAENLVDNDHGNIPAVIIRPSGVSPSYKEPTVGYIEKGFTAMVLLKACMKGINRVLLTKPDNTIDLIPVDYVANLCIVAAAKYTGSKEVEVYNSCTSGDNPLLYKQFIRDILAESRKHKYNAVPLPMVYFTSSRRKEKLVTLLLQVLPAYIADTFLLITGRKGKYVELQANIAAMRDKLGFVSSRSWKISAARSRALSKSLSPSDRHLYPCDPADIDWKEYITNAFSKGIRQYL